MAAVNIDVHAHIGDIYAVKNDAAGGRILHAVQASQKCTFSGAGRANDYNDVTFIDGHIDSLQDFQITKCFFQINDVYHSSSGSFPSV